MVQESVTVVDSFKGEYDFLSNFHPVDIITEGFVFKTVEHAYQASKSNNYMDWRLIEALDANQAGMAKRMGRKFKIRANWNLLKISLMRRFLEIKFNYPELRAKLLATGNAELIEGNYWHDNYWGNCKCKKCESKPGFNNLGKLLMKIRSEYANPDYRGRA